MITEHAIHQFGLPATTFGWLIQTPHPPTGAQITNARLTAAGYLAAIAYSWDNSLDGLSSLANVPTENLLIILVGMPLIAAAAGWLLAGREPPAIAHQPIE